MYHTSAAKDAIVIKPMIAYGYPYINFTVSLCIRLAAESSGRYIPQSVNPIIFISWRSTIWL